MARQCSTNAAGALYRLTVRNPSPSLSRKLANLAPHRCVAFANIDSNTGCNSPGELLMALKHLGRRGLLLQRLAEIVGALAQIIGALT